MCEDITVMKDLDDLPRFFFDEEGENPIPNQDVAQVYAAAAQEAYDNAKFYDDMAVLVQTHGAAQVSNWFVLYQEYPEPIGFFDWLHGYRNGKLP